LLVENVKELLPVREIEQLEGTGKKAWEIKVLAILGRSKVDTIASRKECSRESILGKE